MRKAVAVAVFLGMAFGVQAGAHPLADLDAASRAASQASDLRSVVIFRGGLVHAVGRTELRPDLFPAARRRGTHLLNEAQRTEVRDTWKSFLDYTLALDSLERFHLEYAVLAWKDRSPSFHVARGAFLAQYRFALDFIHRVENDPKLPILLNEPLPALGLPAGSYDRLKFRFLNVTASSQLAAYGALARLLPAPPDPALVEAAAADEARLLEAGRGRRQILTAANSLNVLAKVGQQVTFPVQVRVSEWMGDT